jgi:hypothetical protein
MTLPRFFSRVDDAISPLLSDTTNLHEFLEKKTVCLAVPEELEKHPIHLAGLLLATNLCARVYPRLRLIAPTRIAEQCAALARRINPLCDVELGPGKADAILCWSMPPIAPDAITVTPTGWDVLIDSNPTDGSQSTNVLTTLAAGAIGASELFRHVFAPYLTSGRSRPSPSGFNILTLAGPDQTLPNLPESIDIGKVHLVGAGAIGQAMVHALSAVRARGTLVVVDPEDLSLSNLQRYILALDIDVGSKKTALAVRALKGSGIECVAETASWSLDVANLQCPETVCVAVDTEALRIAIQAGLPKRLYNAWTQPSDIGWSRHESFGDAPCLACLYWPSRPKPSYDELIAHALKEHRLRALTYLVGNLPIDVALKREQIPRLADLPAPPQVDHWLIRSLLDDVAERFRLTPEDIAAWKGKQLGDLYREGVCAGALIRHQGSDLTEEIAVPLAHQSALAGIMLTTQLLVAASPTLAGYRHPASEGRLNLLAGFPQLSARPRLRTANCMCSDPDFLAQHNAKWSSGSPTSLLAEP